MANKFWVLGTGTWSSSNIVNWATSSGGTGGTAVPTTGDTVTFDGNSGTGTVTVDATINNMSFASITCGAFVGTLDFSVNNPSITLTANTGFSSSGTAVRTINLGSGTFTLTGNGTVWDCGSTASGNLTLNAGTSTLYLHGALNTTNARQMNLNASQIYNIIKIDQTGTSVQATQLIAGTAVTITTLLITAPIVVSFVSTGVIYTITNAFTWAGTAFNNVIEILGSGTATIAAAAGSTLNWAVLGGITFSGTAVNATNSFDLKGNTMNGGSITGPGGGSSSGIIGS